MSQRIQDISQNSTSDRSVRNIATDKNADGEDNAVSPKKDRNTSSWGIWFMIIIALLFVFFGLSVVFSGTIVHVTPKTATISLQNSTTTASHQSNTGGLQYEIMTVTESAQTTLPPTGTEEVERYATGTITVYNDHNTSPLNLVENTRFESESGLIYKAPEAFTVPGQRQNSAGETIPGTTTIMVRAAEPGASYNLNEARFTIPGLVDFPSYEDTYAQVETPITGGASGTQQTVAEPKKETAREELRTQLENTLLSAAHSQKPESFILYDDATFISFESLPNKSVDENSVAVRQKATLHGIIFENAEIARYLANNNIESYDEGDVRIQSPDNLSFKIEGKSQLDPESKDPIEFTLSGDATLVWQFDENSLREDLINQDKNDVQSILTQYPSITKAEVIMRPFWKRTFPQNPEEIELKSTLTPTQVAEDQG